MKNVYTIKVAFGDTDAAGIVFSPNYYRWMDQATHDFISKTYISVSKLLMEENVAIPILESFCKFQSPLLFEDMVEIHTKVMELKNKVFKLQHDFVKNGEVIASGYELRAWTSKVEGKLKAVPIPREVQESFTLNQSGRR